ncbi:MAG: OmpW family protein [Proteobacteria bacterium]|nr:OmpW family protein [Pseudomonadota bacterium]
MKIRLLLAASAAAFLGAGVAQAADLGARKPVAVAAPVETFNPWMVRFRALAVVPRDNSKVFVGGTRIPGSGNLDVSNSGVPELDITYFFTKNFAAELILGTTPHNVKTSGNLAGLGKVGRAWLLPPTLTAQYHFNLTDRIKPYVGAGVNYTFFLDEKEKGVFSAFNLKNQAGLALQAGVDIAMDQKWGINVDVKKLFLQPNYRAVLGGTVVHGKARIDPWLIGGGVYYRF